MPILTGEEKRKKESLNSRLGENGCRGKYIISENADLAKRRAQAIPISALHSSEGTVHRSWEEERERGLQRMLRRSTEVAQRERKSRRKNKLRNSSYNYEGRRKQENLNIDPKGCSPVCVWRV